LTPELDHRRESLSSADSDSTTDRSYGIDSVMQQFDTGNESVARPSARLARKDESVVASGHMKKAALYARVSSEGQKNERTIESQIAELKRQIASSDHVLVKEYIDDGFSGA
jgi:hypothetical protein